MDRIKRFLPLILLAGVIALMVLTALGILWLVFQ